MCQFINLREILHKEITEIPREVDFDKFLPLWGPQDIGILLLSYQRDRASSSVCAVGDAVTHEEAFWYLANYMSVWLCFQILKFTCSILKACECSI